MQTKELYDLIKIKIKETLEAPPTVDEWGNEVNPLNIRDLSAMAGTIIRMMEWEAKQKEANEIDSKVQPIPALPPL